MPNALEEHRRGQMRDHLVYILYVARMALKDPMMPKDGPLRELAIGVMLDRQDALAAFDAQEKA